MKLSGPQQKLLNAINSGVTVHFMPYMGRFNPHSYYFRADTNERCTVPARSLLRKGLVKKINDTWRGHELVKL